MIKKREYKVASFFAGVGGLDLAFSESGFRTVFANEIDEFPAKTFKLNFPEVHLDVSDISVLDERKVPDCDVIVGGFPCQAFSVAGYRKGFEDERGVLFFDLMRIVEEKRPRVVFAENVRNLMSHDKGKTFEVMLDVLKHLGYFVKYKNMNTYKYTHIPQNRDRVYVIAFKHESDYNNFDFPKEQEVKGLLENYIDYNQKVDDKYYYERFDRINDAFFSEERSTRSIYQWRRHYIRENMNRVCPTLTANMGTGGHNVPLILAKHGLRKLTPRECFSLQGFPNSFKLPEVSDAKLYKQAGNSVTVPMIKLLSDKIYEILEKNSS